MRTTPLCLIALLATFTAVEARAQDDMDFGDLAGDDEGSDSGDAASEAPAAAPAPERKPVAEASADEAEANANTNLTQTDRIRAVSRKTFLKRGRFDVTPFGGVSTNDAFFRHWHVGTRASYHLVDSLSLEIGGAWVPLTEALEPVAFLRRTQNAVTDDAAIFGFGEVGVTFAPVYGKVAVMKEWIIHFDAFVSGGVAGMVTSNVGFIEGLPAVHPTMEVGVGARVFLLPWLVFRGDMRDYIYPQDRSNISTVQNLLLFNLGVSLFFPFDFNYENQAFRIVG